MIKNNKVSLVKENKVEEKIKNKLKEDYRKYLKEDDEDASLEDTSLEDDSMPEEEMDLGSEGEGENIAMDTMGDDDSALDSLTDTEEDWLDSEVDSLLEPAAEEMELSGEPIGELGGEELGEIIDSDETYHELGDTLAGAAKEEDDEVEYDDDSEFDSALEGDESEEDLSVDNMDLEEEIMLEAEIEEELQEAIKKHKNKLKENSLATSLKSIDFEEEDTKLEGTFSKVNSKEQPAPKDSKFDKVAAATKTVAKVKEPSFSTVKKESIQKSAMLVKAGQRINKLQKENFQLRLENFKLLKANGLLSTVGDKLDKESRGKIVESFAKCKDGKQVKALYEKIVNIVKEKSKGSLNEAVAKVKTGMKTTNLLKENKGQEKQEIDQHQARINYLMGIKGASDEYLNM